MIRSLWIAAGLLLIASSAGARAQEKPPNLVIFLADDQGWGDLGVNGNTQLATPHIDSLARDGAILDRFFVSPVCSPTRAEFLTGRYHLRGGVRDVSRGGERLNLDERTIADAFKAAGYATGAFGKWHNGSQFPYHPNGRGFGEYYGFTSGHWGDYFDARLLDHNGRLEQGKGFLVDDLTDHALKFIEDHKARPFFCYVPFNTPHTPAQVPDRFYAKFAGLDPKLRPRNPAQEDVALTRAVLAMSENIDWNVGRVLERLEALKLSENTIVLYFSDNGPNGWRWNGGMKGRKGSTDEGGVRSPFLIRWPGHIKAGTRIPQIAGAIDFLPTLADLAGVPFAGKKPLDGVSLKPLLLGTAKDWPDRAILSHWNGKFSLRTQRHRLDDAGRLYDMEADPGQDRDLSKEQPEATARLQAILAPLKKELALPKKDDRPFSVGYPESPVTPLPARGREAERRRAQLLLLHELDATGGSDRLADRGRDGRRLRGDALLHLPEGRRRLDRRVDLQRRQARRDRLRTARSAALRGGARPRVARLGILREGLQADAARAPRAQGGPGRALPTRAERARPAGDGRADGAPHAGKVKQPQSHRVTEKIS